MSGCDSAAMDAPQTIVFLVLTIVLILVTVGLGIAKVFRSGKVHMSKLPKLPPMPSMPKFPKMPQRSAPQKAMPGPGLRDRLAAVSSAWAQGRRQASAAPRTVEQPAPPVYPPPQPQPQPQPQAHPQYKPSPESSPEPQMTPQQLKKLQKQQAKQRAKQQRIANRAAMARQFRERENARKLEQDQTRFEQEQRRRQNAKLRKKAILLPCPSCVAGKGENCVSPSGNRLPEPHLERIEQVKRHWAYLS